MSSVNIPKGKNLKWEKDVFVDVQIANRFAGANDTSYKQLIQHLLAGDKNNPESCVLILSTKLINKYFAGSMVGKEGVSPTSIRYILAYCIHNELFNSIGDDVVNGFYKKQFLTKGKKRMKKSKNGYNVKVNEEDKYLFPLVFFSKRKKAIIRDKNFRDAVLNWSPFSKGVIAVDCPSKLDYK